MCIHANIARRVSTQPSIFPPHYVGSGQIQPNRPRTRLVHDCVYHWKAVCVFSKVMAQVMAQSDGTTSDGTTSKRERGHFWKGGGNFGQTVLRAYINWRNQRYCGRSTLANFSASLVRHVSQQSLLTLPFPKAPPSPATAQIPTLLIPLFAFKKH